MKVTLRERKLKSNKSSLYLDFYPPIIVNGQQTRREFLSLYVHDKPKTTLERDHNKETRILAQSIAAKRQLDLQAHPHGFVSARQKKGDFLSFFREAVERRRSLTASYYALWENLYYYLNDFCNGSCTFVQVDREFVERFRSYLLTCDKLKWKESRVKLGRQHLAPNTAKEYFDLFRSVVREAFEKRRLSDNPARSVKPLEGERSKRGFLLLEELKKLAATDCDIPDGFRRAALFSALTGLRHSDIANLTWSNIRHSSTGAFLDFKIKKTGEEMILPISEEARELLGDAGAKELKVFPGLIYNSMTNAYLERWMKAAGIERRLTFHALRHTWASAQLAENTDLFTVSRMLGHRNIRTTQIYAHLLDEKKREAAGKVKLK